MLRFLPAFALSMFTILACSSNPVDVRPLQEVPGETKEIPVEKPVPTSWQLPQFESAWKSANSSEAQLKVLKDLQAFAGPGFDVWGLWQGFAHQRFSWPKPEWTSVHQELLNLQKLSCDGSSVNAFATFALAVANSSQPHAIRNGYREAAFGQGRLCNAVPSIPLVIENFEYVLRDTSPSESERVVHVVSALDLLENSVRQSSQFDFTGQLVSDEGLGLLEEITAKASLFEQSSISGARLVSLGYSLSRFSSAFEPLRAAILRSALDSTESFKIFLSACDKSAECKLADVMRAWSTQPAYQLEALSEAELLTRVEMLFEIVAARDLSDLFKSYNELRAFLALVQKVEDQIPAQRAKTYHWASQVLDRWTSAFAERPIKDSSDFGQWINSKRNSQEPLLDTWILSMILPESSWAIKALASLAKPTSESDWLKWRSFIRLPVENRIVWKQRKEEYCNFLKEALGLVGGQLSSQEFASKLSDRDGLNGGCWNVSPPAFNNQGGKKLEVSAETVSTSAESLIEIDGTSLTVTADRIKLGIVDLSSVESMPPHKIDRENSKSRQSRDSVIFPILYMVRVPGEAQQRRECQPGEEGYYIEADPQTLNKHKLRFCAGQHLSVFHFPLQVSQDGPGITAVPERAPDGGSLDLTATRKVFERFQFVSFATTAQLPYPAEKGGRSDRSFKLSAFGNPETEQSSLKSFVSSYEQLTVKADDRVFFHERLQATEIQSLLAQVFVNLSPDVQVVVPFGYLDLLHKEDRAQIRAICKPDDQESLTEEDLKNCFARWSPEINRALNRILRLSPDDYSAFRRFDDSLVCKVSFEGEDGSDFFDSGDSVFLYGGKDGAQGSAGEAGRNGSLLLNEWMKILRN